MLCRGFYASLVRSHIAYSMQWSFKIRPSCVAGVGPKLQGSASHVSGTTGAPSKSYLCQSEVLSLVYKVNVLVR